MVIDNSHENTLWQAPAGLLRQKRKIGVGEIDLSEIFQLGLVWLLDGNSVMECTNDTVPPFPPCAFWDQSI